MAKGSTDNAVKTTGRGSISAYDPQVLFEYWYRMFSERFCNGRRIEQSGSNAPYTGDRLNTSAMGYS